MPALRLCIYSFQANDEHVTTPNSNMSNGTKHFNKDDAKIDGPKLVQKSPSGVSIAAAERARAKATPNTSEQPFMMRRNTVGVVETARASSMVYRRRIYSRHEMLDLSAALTREAWVHFAQSRHPFCKPAVKSTLN